MPISRRRFITILGGATLASTLKIYPDGDSKMKMPVLFLGHGSPMNAIEENYFTSGFKRLALNIPKPKAILVISAHWETNGTIVTEMERPKTIHDFYGFPQALFNIQYPAKGSPELAKSIQDKILVPKINGDLTNWGLDHGTWSLLVHMYPKADIPVLQLSLDKTKDFSYHYELGKQLSFLRDQGVLIMGSGNIVHNLREISWQSEAPAHDWAQEFDLWVKQKIMARDFNPLIKDVLKSKEGKLSIPTPEHYLPLLYTLGASEKAEVLSMDIEGIQ